MEDYISINKQAYDALADEYKEKYKDNVGALEFYSIIEKLILRKYKDNACALEIGPGTGEILNILIKNNIAVTAVELSSNMVKIAKDKCPKANIINDNILDISFENNKFDYIFAMAVIHNFKEHDLIILLNNIKSWLKEDGYFILDTTNNKVTETGFFEKEDYNTKVIRYRRKWKKEDLEIFLINQGFLVDELIDYVDPTSKKEWLVFSLKKRYLI